MFYKKLYASKLAIPERSAHSKQNKLAVMVEEWLRRLRNHSRGLDWEQKRKYLDDWAMKLKRSGYPQTFRHQVIKAAVEKWEKMCQDKDKGTRPIERARVRQLHARRLEKERRREALNTSDSPTNHIPNCRAPQCQVEVSVCQVLKVF